LKGLRNTLARLEVACDTQVVPGYHAAPEIDKTCTDKGALAEFVDNLKAVAVRHENGRWMTSSGTGRLEIAQGGGMGTGCLDYAILSGTKHVVAQRPRRDLIVVVNHKKPIALGRFSVRPFSYVPQFPSH
jgi:hypothetical protein